MFGLGTVELVVIGVVAVLLFGKRLPEVARSLGKGMTEFKKGLHGVEDEISSTGRSSGSRAVPRYNDMDDRDEPTAPKFEPPPEEPQAANEPKAQA